MEHRNDSRMPVTMNGSRRHGQFEWHNADCQIEDYGIKVPALCNLLAGDHAYHKIWCITHGQWAHETPVSVQFVFENGEVVTKKL